MQQLRNIHELPNSIKTADSVQNFNTARNIGISKGVYLTVRTIDIYPLTFFNEVLLNIIGEKGSISNINYYLFFIF